VHFCEKWKKMEGKSEKNEKQPKKRKKRDIFAHAGPFGYIPTE
jgi:hypothetical protein